MSYPGGTVNPVPVRPTPPSLSQSVNHVRLYLDDLAELDGVVRRVSPKAKLEANGYELDSLDELAEVPGGPIRSMRWFAMSSGSFGSYLSVNLSSTGAKVIARDYDDAIRGAAANVVDVLRRSRRRVGPLGWHWAIRIVILLALSSSGFWLPEGWWAYPMMAAALI